MCVVCCLSFQIHFACPYELTNLFLLAWWNYSSQRFISFHELMPSNSALSDQSTGRAHWFLLPLQLFFLAFFGRADNLREHFASSPNRHLSHPLLLIPLGTPSLNNTLLLASHTLSTNQGPTYWPATPKGTLSHSHSFTPATIINLSLLCCLKEVSLFIYVAK